MPSPQPSALAREILDRTRAVADRRPDRQLELAVNREVYAELVAALDLPDEQAQEMLDDPPGINKVHGIPLVHDETLPAGIGGWTIRPVRTWPNGLTDGAIAFRRALAGNPHGQELAVTTEVLDELKASIVGGALYPTDGRDSLAGFPLVVDDTVKTRTGLGFEFRHRPRAKTVKERVDEAVAQAERTPLGPPFFRFGVLPPYLDQLTRGAQASALRSFAPARGLVVRNDRGHSATVGHGADAVALIVAGEDSVSSVAYTPAQARSLAALLIEQARHAETALEADEEAPRV